MSILSMVRAGVAVLIFVGLPAGCAAVSESSRAETAAMSFVETGWSHRPEAENWNRVVSSALDAHGAALVASTPADVGEWCPAYAESSSEERKAFWVGLLSALAKHESTWNPRAVGGGGKWFGLVQIAPATARLYGCTAGSGEALKDGAANLSCAVRIMAHTVPRDGVIAEGMRGVAADWGPFHSAKKRSDMMASTRAQPVCQG